MNAWSKIWQNIGWQNRPSRLTPLGSSNLSKLDGFNDAIDDRVVDLDGRVTGLGTSKLDASEKGSVNGVAELDSSGLVPSTQLPSYVDDVVEGTAQNVQQVVAGTYSADGFIKTGESSAVVPESGKIYLDTTLNIQFRWTGTSTNFISIGSGLALGETSSTAYRGDRGKTAYDHATESGKISQAVASGLYKIAATVQGHIASMTAVTKSDITALGIADNLDDLSDIELSNPTNDQVLKYNSTSQKWENGTGGGGGASALNDLSDVDLGTLLNADNLVYNSTSGEWENTQIRVELTEAQFNQLSQAQKDDPRITYYVTDKPSLGYPIQDDGSATDLTDGALATGRTIENLLNKGYTKLVTQTGSMTYSSIRAIVFGNVAIVYAGIYYNYAAANTNYDLTSMYLDLSSYFSAITFAALCGRPMVLRNDSAAQQASIGVWNSLIASNLSKVCVRTNCTNTGAYVSYTTWIVYGTRV